MQTVPIFDALAHPTITGNWLGRYKGQCTFEELCYDLKKNNFIGACAIGMADIEDYSHEAFIRHCHPYRQLIPIAGFNPKRSEHIANELSHIKQLGYRGIKIHPRFSKLIHPHFDLTQTLQIAAQLNLVVFYCTYMHCQLESYPTSDPFYHLVNLLKQVPQVKMVLVHGGDIQVLRYAELVRFNPNLLLDLSLTLMKYEGSSVDADLRFLFQKFDRRICIGTDYPEYSPQQVRKRYNLFATDLTIDKKENIAHRNIVQFLSV